MTTKTLPDAGIVATPVTASSTLAEAYELLVKCDKMDAVIKSNKASAWDRLRQEVNDIARDEYVKAGNDYSKINLDRIVGRFKSACDKAVSQYKDEADDKAKRTWSTYKSKLLEAIGLGFNFVENPVCTQTDLKNHKTAITEAAEKAAAEKYGDDDGSGTDTENENQNSQTPDPVGNTNSGDTVSGGSADTDQLVMVLPKNIPETVAKQLEQFVSTACELASRPEYMDNKRDKINPAIKLATILNSAQDNANRSLDKAIRFAAGSVVGNKKAS